MKHWEKTKSNQLSHNFLWLVIAYSIALLPFTLYPLPAKAADMIIATVDKNEIFLGDVVKLNLSISDPNLKIKFPEETPDYRVEASSISSSFQIINGITSQNKTLSYVIKPLRVGNINLPEATASDGTNSYKSQNIIIKVTAGSKIQKLPVAKAEPTTQAPSQPQVNENKSVFVKVKINNSNPYVNEQIHLSLKIYHRGNLVEINPSTLQIPLSDFVKKMDTKAKEYKESVNGLEYLVYQLDYTLFPLKSGTIVIPEHELQGIVIEDAPYRRGSFDPFRIVNPFIIKKPIHFSTNQLKLNVKAIPTLGQPVDYHGYVGDLAVTHQISKLEIEAGEAITLTTKIYGSGSANSVETDFIRDSKQYSVFKDKEENSEEINNSILYFETVINTAIVPNKDSGRVSIETSPLISFNPKTGAFEEHGKESFEITIIPSKTRNNNNHVSKKEKKEEIINKEILNASIDQITNYKEKKYNSGNILLLILLINILYFVSLVFKKFKNSNLDSSNLSHRTTLKEIKASTNIAEISKVFKEFLHKRTKVEDKELVTKINEFINETDRLNYSGRSSGDERLEEFKNRASSLIKELTR